MFPLRGELTRVGVEPETGRSLCLLHLSDPSQFPRSLRLGCPHFVCLVVWDAREASDESIAMLVTKLLQAGCVYICAQGEDCGRVHNLFDRASIRLRPDGPVAISTCHPNQPLSDTLRIVLFTTTPVPEFAADCRAVLAVVINSEGATLEVLNAFMEPTEFEERYFSQIPEPDYDD